MKKTEAISILATLVRPREAKDRARYDEAVKMAIEALRCSEIPNSSDSISRQAAIDALGERHTVWTTDGEMRRIGMRKSVRVIDSSPTS